MSHAAAPDHADLFRLDRTYHELRVLLLLAAVFRAHPGTAAVDGLTKLAKLDFLVRYPMLAWRVLDGISADDPLLHADASDARGTESPMIRYRYGPWDDRYYPVVGALLSRELITRGAPGHGRITLDPTERGRSVAEAAATAPQWREVADRCGLVARHAGGLNARRLTELIQDRLPEIGSNSVGEVIR